MTNGWYFDLYALAFAALAAGFIGLGLLVASRRNPKPHDWAKEWPEFKIAKDAHVRRLP